MTQPDDVDPNEIFVLSEPLPRPDQHRSLTPEYWSRFTRAQQVLMIANEMNRASKLFDPDSRAALLGCYSRVLALADLTASMPHSKGFRRELLRFREMVGAQYIATEPDAGTHGELFYALLTFTPESFQQVPHVTGLPARLASVAR